MSKTLIPFGAVMASSLGVTTGGKKMSPEKSCGAGDSGGQAADGAAKAPGNGVGDGAKAKGECS